MVFPFFETGPRRELLKVPSKRSLGDVLELDKGTSNYKFPRRTEDRDGRVGQGESCILAGIAG